MHRTSVLLPAPDNPIIPNISPSLIVRLMLSRAVIFPFPVLNVLLKFLICIIFNPPSLILARL